MESVDDPCVLSEPDLGVTQVSPYSHGNTRVDVRRQRIRLATSGAHRPL